MLINLYYALVACALAAGFTLLHGVKSHTVRQLCFVVLLLALAATSVVLCAMAWHLATGGLTAVRLRGLPHGAHATAQEPWEIVLLWVVIALAVWGTGLGIRACWRALKSKNQTLP